MAFVKLYYSPISDFERVFDFEDALATRPFCNTSRYTPSTEAKASKPDSRVHCAKVDLHESEESNAVTATFELPGLTQQDVVIEVQQNQLIISGEHASSDSEEGQSYVIRERQSGKFSRTLRLPFGTQPEDVKAKMENGILTVTFPRTTPQQQAKRITIQ